MATDHHLDKPVDEAFYQLNPTYKLTPTRQLTPPHPGLSRGWLNYFEAQATLGGRVQHALAGGENLTLRNEHPADVRDLRYDYLVDLAQQANRPAQPQPPSRPQLAAQLRDRLARLRHPAERRGAERGAAER